MPPEQPLISYAQNGEDIVLARGLRHNDGFYVDIGAFHPDDDSVTKLFYERGWHGINVDPLPEVIELFEDERPRDINVQVAIATEAGTADLWTGPPHLMGHSTLDPGVAAAHRADGIEFTQSTVQTVRLEDLLDKAVPAGTVIDFLKIDVEGFEQAVLESCDWSRWHPRVVVVECIAPYSTKSSHGTWEHLLLSSGYTMALFDGLNRFYVDSSQPDLIETLSAPASVVDMYERSAVHELSERFAELTDAKEEAAAARAAHEQVVHRAEAERLLREESERQITALKVGLAELSQVLAENVERQRSLTVEIDRRDALLEALEQQINGLRDDVDGMNVERESARAELEAMRQTKLFRYTRLARRLYARILKR